MGAYFAQTLDQLKAIYVNLHLICVKLGSMYVNLRQFTLKLRQFMGVRKSAVRRPAPKLTSIQRMSQSAPKANKEHIPGTC